MKVYVFRAGELPITEVIEVAKKAGADIALSEERGGVLTSVFALNEDVMKKLIELRFKTGSPGIHKWTFKSLFSLAETKKFLERKFKIQYVS